MNGRLESLLRQREIIREHLRWLEHEISAAHDAAPVPSIADLPSRPAPSAPAAAVVPQAAAVATAVAMPEATPSMDVAEVDVRSIHSEVRRGCLLYASVAVALLGGLVGFIYWRY